MAGPHRRALTRTLRATGLVHVPEEAMLVELLRYLADEMDREPSTRITAAYLSAQKDLRRVLSVTGGRVRSSAEPPSSVPPADEEVPGETAVVSGLAAFKEKRGIA